MFRWCGDIVYPIYWSAREQKRAARSSATAVILAGPEHISMCLYMRPVMVELQRALGI